MPFCGKCGAEMQDATKFCSSCGAEINAGTAVNTEQQQPGFGEEQSYKYEPPIAPGAPSQEDIRDAQDNKTMAIVAYLLFFIPLLTGDYKKSAFLKFHTNQGTVLFVAAVALSVVTGAISFVIWAWPIILFCAILVIAITGIINAANGVMKPLPIIGGIELIK